MKNISYKSINGKITYVNRLSKEKYIKIKFHNKKRNLKKMILTAGPSVSSRELVYTLDAAMSGWNENSDYYLEKLSKSFSNFIGVNYAIPTSSCTGALHIALKALGIKKGDEVIIPNITWVATASVVQFVGAKPIFVTQNNGKYRIRKGKVYLAPRKDGTLNYTDYIMMAAMARVTMKTCQVIDAICIDIANELFFVDGDHYDGIHTTPTGSEKIGRYLHSKLKDIIPATDS